MQEQLVATSLAFGILILCAQHAFAEAGEAPACPAPCAPVAQASASQTSLPPVSVSSA